MKNDNHKFITSKEQFSTNKFGLKVTVTTKSEIKVGFT